MNYVLLGFGVALAIRLLAQCFMGRSTPTFPEIMELCKPRSDHGKTMVVEPWCSLCDVGMPCYCWSDEDDTLLTNSKGPS